MKKGLKKLLAGLLVGAMALCATAPAFAADTSDRLDTTKQYKCEFYAYHDADDDGTKEWAPAPKGMNVGCIAQNWVYDTTAKKATITMTSFSIYGITGNITDISGSNVISKTLDDDDNVAQAVMNTAALTTVPGTSVEGIPATLSYSALGGLMTQGMDVYLVIQKVNAAA